ncbi:MAG: CvpA family protein [Flavobacteriales bacterium]|nr:CvpA family protein [Flavobacteriales bacterium]
MIAIDIAILIIALWLAYKGFSRGFVTELASLIALVLGIYGAVHFSSLLNETVAGIGVSEKYVPILSFALMFILILLVVHLIAKIITKLIDALSLSFLNKLGGGVFGALKGLLICTVIVVFVNKLDQRISFFSDEMKQTSNFYLPMVDFGENVFPRIMSEYFPKKEI